MTEDTKVKSLVILTSYSYND